MRRQHLKHSPPSAWGLRNALIGLLIAAGSAFAQTPATDGYTLRAAIEALPRAPAWVAADRAFEIAQRNLDAARGAALSVNATGDLSRVASASNTPELNPELNSVQFVGSFGATASLAVAPWSPIFDALRVAERGVARAELDRLEGRAALIAQTVNLYFEARQAAQLAALSLASLELGVERVEIVKRQLELRTATLEGLRSAEAGLAAARSNARAAQQSAALARRALFVGLGIPVMSDQRAFVTAPLARVLPSAEVLEASLTAVLPQRSDVRRAQLSVEEALDAVSIVARDRLLPQANLNLTLGGANATGQATGAQASASFNLPNGSLSVSTNYGFGSPPVATQLTLNLAVSLPIIAPAADNRIRAAQSALEAAQLALRQALGSAELDIWRVYNAADAASQQVRVAQANLEVSKQRSSDTERRLALELMSASDLSAARIAVRQSEADLEAALATAFVAAVRLEAALGKTDLTALISGEKP